MPDFLSTVFGGATAQKDDDNANQNQGTPDPNKQTNLEEEGSFWDPKTKEADKTPTQNIVVQTPKEEITPEDAMSNHIKGLNLSNNIDVSKLSEDLSTGETSSLSAAFEQVGANAYKAAMTSMNSVMEEKLASMREEIVKESNATVNANMAVSEMNKALPYTEDKDMAPIAKAVLTKLLGDGATQQQATEGVGKFFTKVASEINKTSTPPAGNPGDAGFNPQSQPNNNSGSRKQPMDHKEWLDVLT